MAFRSMTGMGIPIILNIMKNNKNEETGNNYKRVTNRKITKYSH
jgi:hypothetical protein